MVTFAGVGLAVLVCLAELLYVTYQVQVVLVLSLSLRSVRRWAPAGGTRSGGILVTSDSWLRSRTGFAFRCTAFGRKERMPAIKVAGRSGLEGWMVVILSRASSAEESSSEEETVMVQGRRNSFHLHYPGW